MEEVRVKEINLKNGNLKEVKIEVEKVGKVEFKLKINRRTKQVDCRDSFLTAMKMILEELEISVKVNYTNKVLTYRGYEIYDVDLVKTDYLFSSETANEFLEKLISEVEKILLKIKEIDNNLKGTAKAILRVVL